MDKRLSNYSHLKILYLEDDKFFQIMVSDKLKPLVDKLYVGSDGNEGLELFKKYNPHLIITDLNMPELNGLEFIKRVRALDSTIPIIVSSALTDVNSLLKSIDLKVDKYILKPFSPEELISAIDVLSRQIIISKLNVTNFQLDLITDEQLATLQIALRNSFTSLIKEIIGKGAPRVAIKIKNNFLEIYLYDNFIPYEFSLSNSIYDHSFINSLRKSVYESYKNKIEKKLSYAIGLTVKIEDIQISITDSVEKFIFSIRK